MRIAELPTPRIFIAPVGGTRLRVLEQESGRGYTHLMIERDDRNADGVTTLLGRHRLLRWFENQRVINGLVVMPAGSTAQVWANDELLLERVEAHRTGRADMKRTGRHFGMFLKAGERVSHHIERGDENGATTVYSDDLSAIVALWSD